MALLLLVLGGERGYFGSCLLGAGEGEGGESLFWDVEICSYVLNSS